MSLRPDRRCPWENLDPDTEFTAIDATYACNHWPEERKIAALKLLLQHHKQWRHRSQAPHHARWITAIQALLEQRYSIK